MILVALASPCLTAPASVLKWTARPPAAIARTDEVAIATVAAGRRAEREKRFLSWLVPPVARSRPSRLRLWTRLADAGWTEALAILALGLGFGEGKTPGSVISHSLLVRSGLQNSSSRLCRAVAV